MKIILILSILIIIPFIIGVSLRKDPPNLIFGVLNDENELGNYPTELKINENITLFVLVENHGFNSLPIRIYHITGNNNSVVMDPTGTTGSTGGIIQNQIDYTIEDKEQWISNEFNSSFSIATSNNEQQLVIFELWANFTGVFEYFNILFIRLNITN